MERRKLVYQHETFQFLKPKGNDGQWHLYGEQRSVKAANYRIDRRIYDVEIDENSFEGQEALRRLNEYREKIGDSEFSVREGRLVAIVGGCCSPNNNSCNCDDSCPSKNRE